MPDVQAVYFNFVCKVWYPCSGDLNLHLISVSL